MWVHWDLGPGFSSLGCWGSGFRVEGLGIWGFRLGELLRSRLCHSLVHGVNVDLGLADVQAQGVHQGWGLRDSGAGSPNE